MALTVMCMSHLNYIAFGLRLCSIRTLCSYPRVGGNRDTSVTWLGHLNTRQFILVPEGALRTTHVVGNPVVTILRARVVLGAVVWIKRVSGKDVCHIVAHRTFHCNTPHSLYMCHQSKQETKLRDEVFIENDANHNTYHGIWMERFVITMRIDVMTLCMWDCRNEYQNRLSVWLERVHN